MPLRVRAPSSPEIARWRPPWWERLVLPLVGAGLAVLAFWPGEPQPLLALVGVVLGVPPLRPLVVLHEDAVRVRGYLRDSALPIEEISLVVPTSSGLTIWWGRDRSAVVRMIGEGTRGRPPGGPDVEEAVLAARDAYLAAHGLRARPTQGEVDAAERRAFDERGWTEARRPPSPPEAYREVR